MLAFDAVDGFSTGTRSEKTGRRSPTKLDWQSPSPAACVTSPRTTVTTSAAVQDRVAVIFSSWIQTFQIGGVAVRACVTASDFIPLIRNQSRFRSGGLLIKIKSTFGEF
jgi:hypothetical protein